MMKFFEGLVTVSLVILTFIMAIIEWAFWLLVPIVIILWLI